MKHLILFFVIPCLLLAQPGPVKFKHLTIEDGLTSNFVWRILQDTREFLWFATRDGLSCCDGYTFTNFRHQGAGSVSHNNIWAVYENRAGTLWVGTSGGGLNRFDESIEALLESPQPPGVLWFGVDGEGVYKLTRTPPQRKLSNGAIKKERIVEGPGAGVFHRTQYQYQEAGYRARAASNSREALEQIRREHPDLVILDVMMPEMNGFDVAAVLKNDPVTMDIPILIWS